MKLSCSFPYSSEKDMDDGVKCDAVVIDSVGRHNKNASSQFSLENWLVRRALRTQASYPDQGSGTGNKLPGMLNTCVWTTVRVLNCPTSFVLRRAQYTMKGAQCQSPRKGTDPSVHLEDQFAFLV